MKARDGNQQYWRGYKLYLDVADGQIPISGILTAASLHDSQVAIPLATMTAAVHQSMRRFQQGGPDPMLCRFLQDTEVRAWLGFERGGFNAEPQRAQS